MTKNGKKYLRAIAHSLSPAGCEGQTYLRELESCVEDYTAENPDASMETLSAEFGSPQETVSALLSQWMPETQQRYSRYRLSIMLLIAVLLVALLASVCTLVFLKLSAPTYIFETIYAFIHPFIGGML